MVMTIRKWLGMAGMAVLLNGLTSCGSSQNAETTKKLEEMQKQIEEQKKALNAAASATGDAAQSAASAATDAAKAHQMAAEVFHSLAAGTPIAVRTTAKLTTKTSATGSLFEATLEEPLKVDGYLVASRGAAVEGVVDIFHEQKNFIRIEEMTAVPVR
jgi:Tfp pilus assembly protein FimV